MNDDLNIRPYNNKEALLFPPAIGDYLPKDDLAHVIDEAVDELDLTPYYQKISEVGNPSYHPAMMIKIWFYGYATKTYSSRKIEEKLSKDIGFIFLAGMQKPDFKTISEFRRKNLEELKDSFVKILQICHRLGIVGLGEISLDSKVMKANASPNRTYTAEELEEEQVALEKAIEEYLKEVAVVDAKEDEQFGVDKRGNELPEDIIKKEKRVRKMREVVRQLKEADVELKKSGKKKINLTDKDGQFQQDKGRKTLGYRAQVVVDSAEQVIVACDVSEHQNDAPYLLPMVGEILANAAAIQGDKIEPKEEIKLSADGGYSSGRNLAELKAKYKGCIDPYIPQTNSLEKERGKGHDVTSPFHRSKFIYNEQDNNFTCPYGKVLHWVGEREYKGVRYSIYHNYQDCKVCSYFGKCTKSRSGRFIWISEYQPLIDEMKVKLSSPEGKEIYGRRKSTVEPVIGNMSYNLGFREFLLRGLRKVRGEYALMCIAHNLLKIRNFLRELGFGLKEALARGNLPLLNSS